jgi:serine phosphatase RsbU (regulator of sigma subunit)
VIEDPASGGDEKLRRVQAITDAALSHLDLDELLSELLDRTRALLHTDTATVLLLDPSGTELVATAAKGLEEEVRQGVRIPVGAGFAGRVAARREPVAIEHVDEMDVINPLLRAKGVASVLGVPMVAGGRVLGVLHVGTNSVRHFTDDDVELLRLVADRASLATQARLSRMDREATLALQRSLLPARPAVVTGLDVAARYVPGAEVGVGGDWYDLFALPSGHIGVVIGDVAGSGLRAAVVMGRFRSALRAYALESNDPADVLARLDRKIQLFEPNAMATAIYAVIDPTQTSITMSSAGHLPPMLVTPTDAARLTSVAADLPLGAYHDAPRHNTQMSLEAGDCLLFYTDGLVERRDRAIAEGLDMLRRSLAYAPAELVCATVTASLLRDGLATDDIAILAVRRTPAS